MLLTSITEYSNGGATWRDTAAKLVLKKDAEGLSLKPRGSVLEGNKSCLVIPSPSVWLSV